jgi:hypothetical protein
MEDWQISPRNVDPPSNEVDVYGRAAADQQNGFMGQGVTIDLRRGVISIGPNAQPAQDAPSAPDAYMYPRQIPANQPPTVASDGRPIVDRLPQGFRFLDEPKPQWQPDQNRTPDGIPRFNADTATIPTPASAPIPSEVIAEKKKQIPPLKRAVIAAVAVSAIGGSIYVLNKFGGSEHTPAAAQPSAQKPNVLDLAVPEGAGVNKNNEFQPLINKPVAIFDSTITAKTRWTFDKASNAPLVTENKDQTALNAELADVPITLQMSVPYIPNSDKSAIAVKDMGKNAQGKPNPKLVTIDLSKVSQKMIPDAAAILKNFKAPIFFSDQWQLSDGDIAALQGAGVLPKVPEPGQSFKEHIKSVLKDNQVALIQLMVAKELDVFGNGALMKDRISVLEAAITQAYGLNDASKYSVKFLNDNARVNFGQDYLKAAKVSTTMVALVDGDILNPATKQKEAIHPTVTYKYGKPKAAPTPTTANTGNKA